MPKRERPHDMATETGTIDAIGKLHRASCIVAHVANGMLATDDVLPGETLKAAEELILAAMEQIEDKQ